MPKLSSSSTAKDDTKLSCKSKNKYLLNVWQKIMQLQELTWSKTYYSSYSEHTAQKRASSLCSKLSLFYITLIPSWNIFYFPFHELPLKAVREQTCGSFHVLFSFKNCSLLKKGICYLFFFPSRGRNAIGSLWNICYLRGEKKEGGRGGEVIILIKLFLKTWKHWTFLMQL